MMKALLQLFLVGMVGLGLAIACKSVNGSSDLKHEFGQLGPRDAQRFFWKQISDKEMVESSELFGLGSTFYPDSHPAAKYLNAWIPEIHKIVQATNRSPAPMPKVVIAPIAVPNAYVAPTMTCIPIQVIFEGSKGTETSSVTVFSANDVLVNSSQPSWCKKDTLDDDEITNLVALLFEDHKSCYKLDMKEKTLSLKATCFDSKSSQALFDTYKSTDAFAYFPTADRVYFHEGILSSLTEADAFLVLVHELGHYYMGHASPTGEKYNYLYEQDQSHAIAGKPSPISSSGKYADLDKEWRDVIIGPEQVSFVSNFVVPGQKYESWLFDFLKSSRGLIESLSASTAACDAGSCKAPCEALLGYLTPPQSTLMLDAFPAIPLFDTPAARAYYMAYEAKVPACLSQLKLKPNEVTALAGSLAHGRIKLDPSDFDEKKIQTMEDWADRVNELIPAAIESQNKAVAAVYKKLTKSNLGQYTTEQEADEFALEVAARMGKKPDDIVKTWLRFIKSTNLAFQKLFGNAKSKDKVELPGSVSTKECEDAYAKGFKTPIPVGDFTERSHHSDCYRVYDAFREAKLHAKELAALKAPRSPITWNETAWRKVVVAGYKTGESLRRETSGALLPPADSEGSGEDRTNGNLLPPADSEGSGEDRTNGNLLPPADSEGSRGSDDSDTPVSSRLPRCSQSGLDYGSTAFTFETSGSSKGFMKLTRGSSFKCKADTSADVEKDLPYCEDACPDEDNAAATTWGVCAKAKGFACRPI